MWGPHVAQDACGHVTKHLVLAPPGTPESDRRLGRIFSMFSCFQHWRVTHGHRGIDCGLSACERTASFGPAFFVWISGVVRDLRPYKYWGAGSARPMWTAQRAFEQVGYVKTQCLMQRQAAAHILCMLLIYRHLHSLSPPILCSLSHARKKRLSRMRALLERQQDADAGAAHQLANKWSVNTVILALRSVHQ